MYEYSELVLFIRPRTRLPPYHSTPLRLDHASPSSHRGVEWWWRASLETYTSIGMAEVGTPQPCEREVQ